MHDLCPCGPWLSGDPELSDVGDSVVCMGTAEQLQATRRAATKAQMTFSPPTCGEIRRGPFGGGSLLPPWCRTSRVTTTSSTYKDVVLHMLWRSNPQAVDEGKGPGVRCPFCRHADSRVVDSREAGDGDAIRRRRACAECSRRFTTVEVVSLSVLKRCGVTEPFSRTKVISGVRKACQGRPVDEDALAMLAQRVEESIREKGLAEIAAHDVGLEILSPLRELDEVAYLRFASVYRSFESLDDFEAEISALRVASRQREDRAHVATVLPGQVLTLA